MISSYAHHLTRTHMPAQSPLHGSLLEFPWKWSKGFFFFCRYEWAQATGDSHVAQESLRKFFEQRFNDNYDSYGNNLYVILSACTKVWKGGPPACVAESCPDAHEDGTNACCSKSSLMTVRCQYFVNHSTFSLSVASGSHHRCSNNEW